jgi:hypothetical protein
MSTITLNVPQDETTFTSKNFNQPPGQETILRAKSNKAATLSVFKVNNRGLTEGNAVSVYLPAGQEKGIRIPVGTNTSLIRYLVTLDSGIVGPAIITLSTESTESNEIAVIHDSAGNALNSTNGALNVHLSDSIEANIGQVTLVGSEDLEFVTEDGKLVVKLDSGTSITTHIDDVTIKGSEGSPFLSKDSKLVIQSDTSLHTETLLDGSLSQNEGSASFDTINYRHISLFGSITNVDSSLTLTLQCSHNDNNYYNTLYSFNVPQEGGSIYLELSDYPVRFIRLHTSETIEEGNIFASAKI